jgi:hypothetical protein
MLLYIVAPAKYEPAETTQTPDKRAKCDNPLAAWPATASGPKWSDPIASLEMELRGYFLWRQSSFGMFPMHYWGLDWGGQ